MNAISPFALADIRKPAKAIGGALREAGALAANHAARSIGPNRDHAGLGKTASPDFTQIANRIAPRAMDGEGFRPRAARAAFDQVADIRNNLSAAREGSPMAQVASDALRGRLSDAARTITDRTDALARFGAERAMQAHHRLASAPPALPGEPAARAAENLPGADLVRAAYATLIRLT
jgi:hypothetical protein